MTYRKTLVSLALALGALAGGAAQARGNADVQLSIGLPGVHVRLPLPPLPPLPFIVVNQPARGVVVHPGHGHGYGDRDRDGIPNRYDRVYNTRWDRDGDGIPNRYDQRYNPRGDRDRDGVPNRWDRNDTRPDPRGHGGRGGDDRGDRGHRH